MEPMSEHTWDLREPSDLEARQRHLSLICALGEPGRLIGSSIPIIPIDRAEEKLASEERLMKEAGDRYWVPDNHKAFSQLGNYRPRLLFVRGKPCQPSKAVAIVGTRHPDSYGTDLTRRIAMAVASSGAVVVSGGANGVDALAHEAALDAGGRTIAVLGGGLGRPYPASSRPLFDRILAAGSCLVSEYPPSAPPARHHFPERNRLVAALSDAVVVVQAGARSGALITAQWAVRTGRPLFAVPADVWYERSAGCLGLLAEGKARPLVHPRDLASVPGLEAIGRVQWPTPGHRPFGLPAPWLEGGQVARPEVQSPVLDALVGKMLDFDQLLEATNLTAAKLQAELMSLEVAGCVQRLPGGAYIASAGRAPIT